MSETRLPCGRCDCGIYDAIPVRAGLRRFGECQTRDEAERLIPRCKADKGLQCQGALDWLGGMTFPINAKEILHHLGAHP